tara:strand:- start:4285 stop:4617 length:333 start_codon:yes stop_codon:yes gene_type:complete
MTIYTPNNWVILHIKAPVEHYKVLAGWSGGYLDGDSWRMNSGIVSVEKTEEGYDFIGCTGSVYKGRDNYGLRMNNGYVYNNIKKKHGDLVTLMPEDTDWEKIDWKLNENA